MRPNCFYSWLYLHIYFFIAQKVKSRRSNWLRSKSFYKKKELKLHPNVTYYLFEKHLCVTLDYIYNNK